MSVLRCERCGDERTAVEAKWSSDNKSLHVAIPAGLAEGGYSLALRRPHDGALTMLDVGCGPGGTTTELSSYGHITAIDPSTASQRWVTQRLPDARFLLGGVDQLDDLLGDETFDVVSAFNSLYHRSITDPRHAVESLARQVANGGLLMLEEPADQRLFRQQDRVSHTGRRFDITDLVEPCEAAGLRVVSRRFLHSWAWPAARMIAWRDQRRPPAGDAVASEMASPLLDAVAARLERLEGAAVRRGYSPGRGTGCWVVATRDSPND